MKGCLYIIGIGLVIFISIFVIFRSTDNSNNYQYDFEVGDEVFVEPVYTKTSDEFSVNAVIHGKRMFIKVVGLRPSNVVTMRHGKSYLVKIHGKRPTGDNHYYVTPHH